MEVNRYMKANMYDYTGGMYKWKFDININSEWKYRNTKWMECEDSKYSVHEECNSKRNGKCRDHRRIMKYMKL